MPIKEEENLSRITIRNSTYNFISNMIAKVGGLIFTIIVLARMLGPELFGIYNLTISIIAITLTFTDLGIGNTLIRYLSDAVGKNNKTKARSYFRYLFKLKLIITLIAIIILLLIAKPLSFDFYQKPLLFYPLIFASFYIFFSSIVSLPQAFLFALKDLKKFPKIQLIEQISKFVLSLIAVLILSYEFKVPGVIIAISISLLLIFSYTLFIVMKKDKSLIFGEKTKIQKPRILKFAGIMGIASISLVIFAAVDTLMLGKFVEASYIGFYRAALSIVLSIGALISIRSLLLPIFTQIKKQRLERAVDKIAKYTLMLSIPATIGLLLISKNFMRIVYGQAYELSAIPLYALSFLIIVASLISLYRPLFPAKEKPKILAKFVIIALIINIILNYILIKSLLNFGQQYAILGAGIATLVSRTFLLSCLGIKAKKEFKIKISKTNFIKPIIATIIMALFVIVFNYLIEINIPLLILQISSAILIYFLILFSIKGVTKQDFKLLRYIPIISKN